MQLFLFVVRGTAWFTFHRNTLAGCYRTPGQNYFNLDFHFQINTNLQQMGLKARPVNADA